MPTEMVINICMVLLVLLCEASSTPKVLLVSMDGFRYDYLDLLPPSMVPNFQNIIKNGVKGKLTSVFPTVTYPNHYTLITGLYPENHGLVHNRFYDTDPTVKDHFWYDDRRDNYDPVWFDTGAEPIYVTNKKGSGVRYSASALWPCGLGKVKEIRPDFVYYDTDPFSHINFTKMVDDMVDWFTNKTNPVNLGLMYFDEPDEIAHASGAASTAVLNFVKELDVVIGHLIKRLRDTNLLDDLNVILLADHGFTNITTQVVLEDYGIMAHEYTTGSGFENHITVHIYPNNIDTLYKKFSNSSLKDKLDVYLKSNSTYLKDTLHYSKNSRIAPIIITGKEGGHGYDPKYPDMSPIFLAFGPAFKKGYKTDSPFPNLDIYPLMCHLLGVPPAPNNGSLKRVEQFLKDPLKEDGFTVTEVSLLMVFIVTVLVAGLFAICACHNARKQPRLLLRGFQSPVGNLQHSHHLLQDNDDDDEF
ncbi:ENPP4-like protein [Mya arenaria]|uniref:ENPP4-like protein n=1 Tax=Mya arenaria TaxID=6604 RepID=A0ABY7EKM4_MYAAR|nr:ENPP4-like protein [Mya arenaria]